MAFGPDFFEDDQPAASSKQDRGGSQKVAQGNPKKGAYIGMFIGMFMAVLGFTYGSLINPDAEGIVKLIMFGVAIVGAVVFILSVKKIQR